MPEKRWNERVLEEFRRDVLHPVGEGKLQCFLYRRLENLLEGYEDAPSEEEQEYILEGYGNVLERVYGEGCQHRTDIESGLASILDMQTYLARIGFTERTEVVQDVPEEPVIDEPVEEPPQRLPFGGPIEERNGGYVVGIGEGAQGFRRTGATGAIVRKFYMDGYITQGELEEVARRHEVSNSGIKQAIQKMRLALGNDTEWMLTTDKIGTEATGYTIDPR